MMLCACAWIMAKGQTIGLGLRDNQYVHACYIDRHKWLIGYEQSLLNVKVKEQNGRLFAGYVYEKGAWNVAGIAYGGTEYAGNWQAGGGILKGEFIKKRIGIEATLNANYDTYFDFQMNYDVCAQYVIWKKGVEGLDKQQLDICASFGNLPEYRDNVKNLRIGMKFTSGNLWVHPKICVPNIENKSSKYLRVLCSLGWSLKIK